MNQPAEKTGYAVTFSGAKDYPEETIRRARAMLEALLNESAAPEGGYLFGITDPYPPFEKLATARLEVGRGRIETAILVRLRSRGGSGGSIVGSLYVPSGVKRDALFKDMEITADNFNRGGGWVEALQNLPPNPSRRSSTETSLVVADQKGPGPSHLALLSQSTSEGKRAPVPPSLSVIPVSAPPGPPVLAKTEVTPREEVPMSTMTRPEKLGKLIEFLKVVAKSAADSNGVFSGQGITRFAKSVFPHETRLRWLGQGILFELEGLGWIHHVVGKGQYQIDPAFAVKHALGLTIEQLPEFVRGQETGHKRQGQNQQRGSILEALLEQQRELVAQIHAAVQARQRELVANVEKAKAGIVAAQQVAVEAEAARVAHNEKYAHLLVPAPTGTDSETSVG